MQTKFIFVTGGVMSGLGKGVVSASISKLLQLSDQKVSCVKIDPYLNFDAGTMNPIAHGEVFVTEDGGECDMDIGSYERYLNKDIPKSHNITTAQIYSSVIDAERKGKYLGACVQIIPHITDEIKNRIRIIANDEHLDVLIVECGGTVGDIESLPFLEALRQIRVEDGSENVIFVHVTLAPSLDVVGEQKTKPTQHSVQELRRIGIQPDLLCVRCTTPLLEKTIQKISMFTNVTIDDVFSCHDAKSIFMIPQMLNEQGLVDVIFKKFAKVGYVNTSKNWDKVLRLQAEIENLRKRTFRDIENASRGSIERVIMEILPILDSFELGLNLKTETIEEYKTFKEGQEASMMLMNSLFSKLSIETIDPSEMRYDPELHEVISTQEDDSVEPGYIIKVIQKGYRLKERLLRPARVIVCAEKNKKDSLT